MGFPSSVVSKKFDTVAWDAVQSQQISIEEAMSGFTVDSTYVASDPPADMEHNSISVDWFSFTLPWCEDPYFVVREILHMDDKLFIQSPYRLQESYDKAILFGNVVVAYQPWRKNVQGVCVRMTGQGCRTFEQYTSYEHPFDDLIHFLVEKNVNGCRVGTVNGRCWEFAGYKEICIYAGATLDMVLDFIDLQPGQFFKMTRIDPCFDDFESKLDINVLFDMTDKRYFVSNAKCSSVISSTNCGRTGKTCYIGSRRSYHGFIRIYDKSAEMGFDSSVHWVRVEPQLRHDDAMTFVNNIGLGGVVSDVAVAMLRDRLDFVDPDLLKYPPHDSNFSSNPRAAWWAEFLSSFTKQIKTYFRPLGRAPVSLEKSADWIYKSVAPTLSAVMELDGFEGFYNLFYSGRERRSPRLEAMLKSNPRYDPQMVVDFYAFLDELRGFTCA